MFGHMYRELLAASISIQLPQGLYGMRGTTACLGHRQMLAARRWRSDSQAKSRSSRDDNGYIFWEYDRQSMFAQLR
jgi:hypothetical protein